VAGILAVLSDRIGRRPLLVAGWLLYALVYLGFAAAQALWQGVGGWSGLGPSAPFVFGAVLAAVAAVALALWQPQRGMAAPSAPPSGRATAPAATP
jgi:MFS family permease